MLYKGGEKDVLLVKTAQLQEGCILAEDVVGKSNRVIVPKNTVLNAKLLIVLQKFLVDQVRVQSVLVDGGTFLPVKLFKKMCQNRKQEIIKIY